jgi:mono/diheme cytochrome c family protein
MGKLASPRQGGSRGLGLKLEKRIHQQERGETKMKKTLLITAISILFFTTSTWAASNCPQPRKTKSAPSNIASMDKTAKANAENGKKIYAKKAKPLACKMCHGKKGDGMGKLGKALKPNPRNFTCSDTMKDVSAGQMFWIIKNGSPGTGMVAHKKSMKDKEIWDVVKYIRQSWVK